MLFMPYIDSRIIPTVHDSAFPDLFGGEWINLSLEVFLTLLRFIFVFL